MQLNGGMENSIEKTIDANTGCVIISKQFSPRRIQYDGEELLKKYQLLATSELFSFLDLKVIDSFDSSGKTKIKSIDYLYIPGENCWILSDHECDLVARKLRYIHNSALYLLDGFRQFRPPFLYNWFLTEDREISDIVLRTKKTHIPDHIGFVHGDFHPGNILWFDGKVSGVIDWDNCFAGNILFDVAMFRFDLALFSGVKTAECFVDHYRKQSDIDLGSLWYWDLLVLNNQSRWHETWYRNLHELIPCSEEVAINNYLTWKSIVLTSAKCNV